MFGMVVQNLKAVCNTCNGDPDLIPLENWKATVEKV
jgi:hypothetical protein